MIRFILLISCYFLSLFVDCYKLPFLDSLMKFRGVLPRFFLRYCSIHAFRMLPRLSVGIRQLSSQVTAERLRHVYLESKKARIRNILAVRKDDQ